MKFNLLENLFKKSTVKKDIAIVSEEEEKHSNPVQNSYERKKQDIITSCSKDEAMLSSR